MNRMKRLTGRKILLATVALCAFGIAKAQNAQAAKDTLTLTLDKALTIALDENPTMKVAAEEIALKKVAGKEAWQSLLPEASIAGSLDHTIKAAEMKLNDMSFKMGQDGTNTANAGLSINFQGYRDEMIISSKAGHEMWAGPYGGNSSRKNLMASIDQSLRRTGLEYFDIFYTHRYDGVTPVEETIQALIDIVKRGKALYIGISKYPPEQARIAYEMLAKAGVPCLISQYRYSMFDRAVEAEILPFAAASGSGFIAFSPLAQGLLTDKYLNGIPEHSRAARSSGFLQRSQVTPEKIEAARQLNEIAHRRGQTLAEMALAWVLRDERMTSVIVGASSVNQLADNLKALEHLEFTSEELAEIEQILSRMIL